MANIKLPTFVPTEPIVCSCGKKFEKVEQAVLCGFGIMFDCECKSTVCDLKNLEMFPELIAAHPDWELLLEVLAIFKRVGI